MVRTVLRIALLPALLTVGGASLAQSDAPQYGVCRDEISTYVKQELGQTPTRIDVQSYAGFTPYSLGSALVYVEECSGFHAFAIHASMSTCEHIPHYGKKRGSFVHYEGAFGQCRRR